MIEAVYNNIILGLEMSSTYRNSVSYKSDEEGVSHGVAVIGVSHGAAGAVVAHDRQLGGIMATNWP